MVTREEQIEAVKQRLKSLTSKSKDKQKEIAQLEKPAPSVAPQPQPQYTYEVVQPEMQSPPPVPMPQTHLAPHQKPKIPPLPQQIPEFDGGEYDHEAEDFDDEYVEDEDELEIPQQTLSEDEITRLRMLEAEINRLDRDGTYRAEMLYQMLQLNISLKSLTSQVERIANAQELKIELQRRRRENDKRR